mgnify:CR=1 FL=1
MGLRLFLHHLSSSNIVLYSIYVPWSLKRSIRVVVLNSIIFDLLLYYSQHIYPLPYSYRCSVHNIFCSMFVEQVRSKLHVWLCHLQKWSETRQKWLCCLHPSMSYGMWHLTGVFCSARQIGSIREFVWYLPPGFLEWVALTQVSLKYHP